MSIYMTGSYFYNKIILIVAFAAFLVGGFIPMNIVSAANPRAQQTQAQRDQQAEIARQNYEASRASAPARGRTPAQLAQEAQIAKENRIAAAANSGKTQKQAPVATSKNGEIVCSLGSPLKTTLEGCLAMGAFKILQVSAFVLWAAAAIFDATINYTLNMAAFIKDIPIVDLGWSVFRDVTNLLFIFIILYIAINTIVGNEGYGIKKLLGKVIIGAMLINFSLFFTQAMIDVSNIFALQFYHKITQDAQKTNTAAGESKSNTNLDGGISAGLVNAMGLQQVLQVGVSSKNGGLSKESTGNNLGATGLGLNASNLILVGLGGTGFILITAFVFFAGAMMLLVRTVVLIFLMILSPIAFMGNILPALGKYTGEWWSKLTSNLLFAPVYMMLLYLVMSMVTSDAFKQVGGVSGANGKKTANFASLFAGGDNWIPTIMTFVVLIMLMIGCLIIASKLGVEGGKWAESTGKGFGKSLGMSLSGANMAIGMGRGLAGKAGTGISESKILARASSIPMFGRLAAKAMQGGDKLKDVKIGGRSFNEQVKEEQKDYTKRGNLIEKALLKNDLVEPGANALQSVKDKYAKDKRDIATAAANAEKSYLGGKRFTYASTVAMKKAAKAAQGTDNKEAIQTLLDGKYSQKAHNAAKDELDDQTVNNVTTLGINSKLKGLHAQIAALNPSLPADEVTGNILGRQMESLIQLKKEANDIINGHLDNVSKLANLESK